jgi:hypothetical protein
VWQSRPQGLPALSRRISDLGKLAAPSLDQVDEATSGPSWNKARKETEEDNQRSRDLPEEAPVCRVADEGASKKSRDQPDTGSNRWAADGDAGSEASRNKPDQQMSHWPEAGRTSAVAPPGPPQVPSQEIPRPQEGPTEAEAAASKFAPGHGVDHWEVLGMQVTDPGDPSEKEVPVAAISRTGVHVRRRPGKPGQSVVALRLGYSGRRRLRDSA